MFIYRDVNDGMLISDESDCAEGRTIGYIYNRKKTADVVTPTELPSDKWVSRAYATLATQYASAKPFPTQPEG